MISAEGRAVTPQIALSPAFRALDTHDLHRGLRANCTNRALACISRTRHARSPQRVAWQFHESRSRLHFAHSTRTISAGAAEGCARSRQIALSPAFRALDTHDLRRGLHFRLTLFVRPSAFKREFIKWGNVFSLGHLPCIFHTHTSRAFSILIACSHTHCMLAYSSLAYTYTCILSHLHCILCTSLLSLFHLHRATYSVHVILQVSKRNIAFMLSCKCLSVSVEVSVFKGFSGRTLRNAFGNICVCPQ